MYGKIKKRKKDGMMDGRMDEKRDEKRIGRINKE